MNFKERLEKGLREFSQNEVAPGAYTVREESLRGGWVQVVHMFSVPRQREIAAYLTWLLAYNMSTGIKYDTNADILDMLLKSIGFSSIEDMLENAIDFSDVKYYVDIVDPRNTPKATNTPANTPAEAAKDSIKRINNMAANKVLTMEELSSMSTQQLAAKAAQTVEAINASTKSATDSIKRSGGGGGGGSTGFTTGEVVGIVATLGVLGFCAYKAWDKFYGDGNVNDIELADYGFSSSFVPGANFSGTF